MLYCCNCIEYFVAYRKHRDVEMGVCAANRGFKRNLTQLTGRHDKILVHLCVLLDRGSITGPFSAKYGLLSMQ